VGAPKSLLTTSFSGEIERRQSFPGTHPNDDNYYASGAIAINSLGGLSGAASQDTTYQLSFDVPHSSDIIAFEFSGAGLTDLANEGWGIGNIVISDAAGPQISVTAPSPQQYFSSPAQILIQADARPGSTPIRAVEIYANQTLLTALTNVPFMFVWTNAAAGEHTIRVRARDSLGLWRDAFVPIHINGIIGDYFPALNVSGKAVSRLDPCINYRWGDGNNVHAPILGVDNTFSVQWTGLLLPRYSEVYTLSTDTDDGTRLWIDDVLLIDQWHGQTSPNAVHSATMALQAGQLYRLRMTYYNGPCCGAWARLYWASTNQTKEIIPQSQLQPVLTPIITSLPMGYVTSPRSTVTFAVGVFGSANTSFQWTKNGIGIPRATNSSLVISNVGYADAGVYSALIYDQFGNTNVSASLSVLGINMVSAKAQLTLAGPIGAHFDVQCSSDAASLSGWKSFTNCTASSNPSLFIDSESASAAARFYRAIPIP
jgi:hypothetical protein